MYYNIFRRSLLLGIGSFISSILLANDQLVTLKHKTDRWIELRTRLAEEKNQWESEKDILRTSIETLEANVNSIDESLSFYRNATQDTELKLSSAKEKEESTRLTNEQMSNQIGIYEKRILSFYTKLPQPLQNQLTSLISKIPSGSENDTAPLAIRLQNVVAIMTMVDEFNQNLTHSRSIKNIDGDQNIEVRALYWGLSFGFATNSDGQRAWLLRPGDNGWHWIDYSSNATAVRELFLVYDKKIDPKIVTVPFQVVNK